MSLRGLALRVGTFVSGLGILYHEVFLAQTSEPLLVFLGLWFCGIPPAMFFDSLRKLSDQAKETLKDVAIEGVPRPPEEEPRPPPKPDSQPPSGGWFDDAPKTQDHWWYDQAPPKEPDDPEA